jgi:hypothetical protein
MANWLPGANSRPLFLQQPQWGNTVQSIPIPQTDWAQQLEKWSGPGQEEFWGEGSPYGESIGEKMTNLLKKMLVETGGFARAGTGFLNMLTKNPSLALVVEMAKQGATGRTPDDINVTDLLKNWIGQGQYRNWTGGYRDTVQQLLSNVWRGRGADIGTPERELADFWGDWNNRGLLEAVLGANLMGPKGQWVRNQLSNYFDVAGLNTQPGFDWMNYLMGLQGNSLGYRFGQ